MVLWPSPGDLFCHSSRSQEALEEAVTYCLQKQAHTRKVASSSPKTSWENVVIANTKWGLRSNTEEHFCNEPSWLHYIEVISVGSDMTVLFVVRSSNMLKWVIADPFSVTLGRNV